ncbi:MAG: hypothetical protein AAF609_09880 [Cyanobacteria bacterium P01_C01_bin.120]
MPLVSFPKFKRATVIPLVVVLSAAAHGIILRIPVPPSETAPPTLTETATTTRSDISVVVLPPQPDPTAPDLESEAVVAPQSPSAALPPTSDSAVTAAPAPQPPITPSNSPQLPAENVPAENSSTPSTNQPTNQPPVNAGKSSPNFMPSSDAEPLLSYGSDFPHVVGAVAGCFGLNDCRQVSGIDSYRRVARSLTAELTDDGYTVKLRDDLEDTGRNVYELTPPGGDKQQFLMVFSGDDGSAIYVIGSEIMTLDQLRSLSPRSYRDRLVV